MSTKPKEYICDPSTHPVPLLAYAISCYTLSTPNQMPDPLWPQRNLKVSNFPSIEQPFHSSLAQSCPAKTPFQSISHLSTSHPISHDESKPLSLSIAPINYPS